LVEAAFDLIPESSLFLKGNMPDLIWSRMWRRFVVSACFLGGLITRPSK